MGTLHFVYDKPGAGKTTLARELAARAPAVSFIEEEWLVSLYYPITTLAEYARLRGAFAQSSGRLRPASLNLAHQSCSISRRTLRVNARGCVQSSNQRVPNTYFTSSTCPTTNVAAGSTHATTRSQQGFISAKSATPSSTLYYRT